MCVSFRGVLERGCGHQIQTGARTRKSPCHEFSIRRRAPISRMIVIGGNGENGVTGRRPKIWNDRATIAKSGGDIGLQQPALAVAASINRNRNLPIPAKLHLNFICRFRQRADGMLRNQHYTIRIVSASIDAISAPATVHHLLFGRRPNLPLTTCHFTGAMEMSALTSSPLKNFWRNIAFQTKRIEVAALKQRLQATKPDPQAILRRKFSHGPVRSAQTGDLRRQK